MRIFRTRKSGQPSQLKTYQTIRGHKRVDLNIDLKIAKHFMISKTFYD